MATTMADVKADEMDRGALLTIFIEQEYPELIPEFSAFVDDFNATIAAECDDEDGNDP